MADDAPFLPGLSPIAGKPVQVAFDAGRLTSDGGILLLAEIERRLGIAERLARCIEDPRAPDRIEHRLAEMIRYRALLIAAGYEDANDCDALRTDPAFKMAVGRLPVAIFAQNNFYPEADPVRAVWNQSGRWWGGYNNGELIIALATRMARIGGSWIAASVGFHLNFYHIALFIQLWFANMRQSTNRTFFLVIWQVKRLALNDRKMGPMSSTVPRTAWLLSSLALGLLT